MGNYLKMAGGAYFRFTVGSSGASGKNLSYISRESAVLGEKAKIIEEKSKKDQERVGEFLEQNMPEELLRSETYKEMRQGLIEYATQKERQEKGRSHYRGVFSFEREVDPRKASQMVQEWLKEAIPNARAMGFVHENSEHRHVHLWIEARGEDGRKLHFTARDFKTLDEKWNRIYSREMGRDEREHLEKKQERLEKKYDRGDTKNKREKEFMERVTRNEQTPQSRERDTSSRERNTFEREQDTSDQKYSTPEPEQRIRRNEQLLDEATRGLHHLHEATERLHTESERYARAIEERERSRER
jgi:hypothetical protein